MEYLKKTASDKICELLILFAIFFFIYRSKVKNQILNLNIFITDLYNVKKEMSENSNSFRNNWTPFLKLFKGISKITVEYVYWIHSLKLGIQWRC